MKRTIFISSGHSDKVGRDRGASGNGYVEGVEAVRLRKLVVKELTILGNVPVVDIDNSILAETMAFFKNKTTKDCILLDIHFNAATPAAKGVETLVPGNPSTFELSLGSKLSKAVADVLDTSLRGATKGFIGVKTELESARKSLGWMRLTGENILLETCFISNAFEMQKYEKNIDALAKAIARVLYDASLMQDTITPGSSSVYTVKAGDNLTKIANLFNTNVSKIINDNALKSSNIAVGQKLTIKK